MVSELGILIDKTHASVTAAPEFEIDSQDGVGA
jgi:hypothetical protein